ncbi:protein disulfide-isomerase A6 homolog [Spodoptera litura]|uniref:Protein disulfide-isomerase A6 homolog n=2 Tax=Spodoptera TaxID=7106 RepID=A0A9J7EAS3_SPOLT|nr:protein disulfide-isomerase A6 homolog [Spodoptera litura]XP_035438220.1 protein disulfide-isomerase A6 homolog [Spodoptera frugiperda]
MDLKICFVVLLFSFIKPSSETLQSVSDDDLLELIREKEKLIVLFSKPNCDTCKELENHVESLENDFKKELNAVSVKAINSHLSRLYNPAKDPALVFFRHGVPLLYSGESDENEIYGFFEKNQAPAVKELTDKIFEHITQAATGATTGDWFVMFYGASCVECQRLHAVWESVGATLKGRINVARMDANLAGVNTAKRFNVNKLPSFLFFRLGKVYRFDLPKKDVKSFVIFAQDWYKNAKAEPVPLLASPFDELVDLAVQMIKVSVAFTLDTLTEHPWIWQIGVAGFGLVAITAIIALCKAGKSRPSKDSKKEKKSK